MHSKHCIVAFFCFAVPQQTPVRLGRGMPSQQTNGRCLAVRSRARCHLFCSGYHLWRQVRLLPCWNAATALIWCWIMPCSFLFEGGTSWKSIHVRCTAQQSQQGRGLQERARLERTSANRCRNSVSCAVSLALSCSSSPCTGQRYPYIWRHDTLETERRLLGHLAHAGHALQVDSTLQACARADWLIPAISASK